MDEEDSLNIAIIEPDEALASILQTLFLRQKDVNSVTLFTDSNSYFKALASYEVNSLAINIFKFGIDLSISLIDKTRKEFSDSPICLLGTTTELHILEDVPEKWKGRFKHYYRIGIDAPTTNLSHRVCETTILLSEYWYARVAKKGLQNLKSILVEGKESTIEKEKSINENIKLVERGLQQKSDWKEQSIVPGIEEKELSNLIKTTLDNASKSIQKYALINSLILYFGMIIIGGSFIAAFFKDDLTFLGFGSVGLGGIITTLITNPANAIGKGAKQIVQIQTAYFGLLNQINILNSAQPSDLKESIDKSKRLEEVMNSVQESLSKYY